MINIDFVKRNIVLIASWVLAIVSMFFVPISKDYLEYIDVRTLMILWSIMVIVCCLMRQGMFRALGHRLVMKTSGDRQLGFTLMLLCFFLSMVITNDVALITFVPFTIYIFYERENKKNLIYILVLETMAANLGSMLTPIGNPQNLYLYNMSGMELADFVWLMLPYSAFSLGLLCLASAFILREKSKDEGITFAKHARIKSWPKLIIFLLLFIFAILVVLRFFEPYKLVIATLVIALVLDHKALVKVDYGLLFTFLGLFIFVGNMSELFSLKSLVAGHEMLAAVGLSQIISNVPTALLLSNFTNNFTELIKAVNFGGLGTIIASMASLITFKYYCKEDFSKRRKFLLVFTLMNLLVLGILLVFNLLNI
ncbi:MAG: citrate transporter [Clostridia bacterium]|nr:citrate transporter [Clostridia bacterium]